MKKSLILLASSLVLATSAQAEVEYFYTHGLAHKGDDDVLEYMPQFDGYSADMNTDVTYPEITHSTTLYTMPADVESQNLIFQVKNGYTVEHLTIRMGDHDYSGNENIDRYILLTGYDIDGVHTACSDTLWNEKISDIQEQTGRSRYFDLYLRNINAKESIRLWFDASKSARVTDPQPEELSGEVKAQAIVCMAMDVYYDMKPACYELVTSQDQVKANETYMLTAVSGDKVIGLCSDTLHTATNKYLRGKELPLSPDATKYDGSVSIEFKTTQDETGFAELADSYFLETNPHFDNQYALRTNSLSFYETENGSLLYKITDFSWDPVAMKATYTVTGRTLYADLWEIVINDDHSVSLVSHEMSNKEGRELQYRPDTNYFIYTDSFKYEPKLYLWHKTGESQGIRSIEAPASDAEAPCFDLQGRRLRAAGVQGLYIQGGRLQIR